MPLEYGIERLSYYYHNGRYYPTPTYQQQTQYNVSALVDKYAMPYLLNFLEGKTEEQYHQYMRTRPDFVAHFRNNNRLAWTVVMGIARSMHGRINLTPEYEAQKLVAIIRRRGWRVYRSEYDCFTENIRRLLQFVK